MRQRQLGKRPEDIGAFAKLLAQAQGAADHELGDRRGPTLQMLRQRFARERTALTVERDRGSPVPELVRQQAPLALPDVLIAVPPPGFDLRDRVGCVGHSKLTDALGVAVMEGDGLGIPRLSDRQYPNLHEIQAEEVLRSVDSGAAGSASASVSTRGASPHRSSSL